MAQDVERVLPKAVYTDDNGFKYLIAGLCPNCYQGLQ
jgi:hypothetical protein